MTVDTTTTLATMNQLADAARLNSLVPGGAHTYAKGDDQYPVGFAPIIERGKGSHVWDTDGNEYIEYGMGLRSVGLGHAHPAVVSAARREMERGSNFVRPSKVEIEAAETFLSFVERADMVKFAKNGSDVTTAAVKLARAHTGRDMVAICGGFLSVDDWFIGATSLHGGIPASTRAMTIEFRHNKLSDLEDLFEKYQDQIACVVIEGEREEPPVPGFLEGVQAICRARGALLILDEMVAGMRLSMAGVQELHDLDPDLSTFGKAIANGFAVSALGGKRNFMELGSNDNRYESRVFLLSTTHGAETHGLAAFQATVDVYRREGVIDHLYHSGQRLRTGIEDVVESLGLVGFFELAGRDSNLVYRTRDQDSRPSQDFRALFMQETIRRGLLMPSLVVSHAHSDSDIDRTVEGIREALQVYAKALSDGVDSFLQDRPVRPVFPAR